MNDIPLEIIVTISEYLDEIFIHRTFPLINKRWLELYPKCLRTLRLELKVHWERRLENNRSINLTANKKARLNIFLRECNRIFHVDLSYVHVNVKLLTGVINRYSHQLRELQIPGNKFVNPGLIKKMCAKCKMLKRVDVSYCHKLSKQMANILSSFPQTVELIVCNDLESITWEVLFDFSKSNPNTLLLGMHLLKPTLFDIYKFKKLHEEISSEVAFAYYDFAIVYGYEVCCKNLFEFYDGEFPSLRAIFKAIGNGTRGGLYFLSKNDFSFKNEVPVEIIRQCLDDGHVQVFEVLRIRHCLEHFINQMKVSDAEEWIEKGRFDCVTQLRLGNFKRWNDISLQSVEIAAMKGQLDILNSLRELQYAKLDQISPETVRKGILNGHSKFINAIPVSIIQKVDQKGLPRDIVKKIKHILINKKREIN